jgi:ribonucleoside-diphosphate reductase alpha chain
MDHGFETAGDERQGTAETSFVAASGPVKQVKGGPSPIDQGTLRALVGRAARGLSHVDADRVADRVFDGFPDGSTQRELDALCTQVAANLVAEEPEYARLAARLLTVSVHAELAQEGLERFSASVVRGHELGLINDRLRGFVEQHAARLDAAIDHGRDDHFEYFGLRTVIDRYLLRHPQRRGLLEGPQHFFARVACALAETVDEAIEFYDLLSALGYLPSSPTLFNAGTRHEQLSSCFLVDSPTDDLASIYQRYTDVAMLSKFSGGIGLAYHRVRSRGSLIRSTNGHSNGIVPWLKTLDASVAAVNQGGRRRGACCVYLEPWHADIEEFLELRENTGDQARRTHNLNLACWVPDLFMRRVEADGMWSLFDPSLVPELPDLWGEPFEQAYEQAEAEGKAARRVKARDLYARMMRSLAQTGNGWMTFKDTSNRACNQTALPGRAVHHSNLCVAPETMILTRDGHEEIGLLEGRDVEVWNGFQWSAVKVRKTGTQVEMVRVKLSNGVDIDCTPEHQFAVSRGYGREGWDMVAAADLVSGTKLAKFSMPSVATDATFSRKHYAHGFFCGDGTYEASGRARTTLYGEKRSLASILDLDGWVREDSSGRVHILYDTCNMAPKFQVPHQAASVGERLSWFAGLLDSDGCVARNGANESLQVGSIHLDFLRQVRLMLATLGVDAKVTQAHQGGERMLPDGQGGDRLYPTQPLFRLLVTSMDTHKLVQLGLPTRRLNPTGKPPARDARQFTEVVSVEWQGRVSDTFCFTEQQHHLGTFNGVVTGQCTEIIELSSPEETAVCNLGSINLARHVKDGAVDFAALARTVRLAVRHLDRTIDLTFYPIPSAGVSNLRWRPVGLGVMGLQDVFFQLRLPFDSAPARALSRQIAEEIYLAALTTSCELARDRGAHPSFAETRAARGELQFDAWKVTPTDPARWDALRALIQQHGLRNSLLIAIAPTATIASIAGCYECIEPQLSNLFKRETLSGDFLQINRHLIGELRALGRWDPETREAILASEGSIQGVAGLPEDLRAIYRTVWEIPMRSLIDMAAERGPFIDQSQSLNLFVESPSIGQLSSMYFHAWKKGLKTTYYLRSRPATRIARANATPAPGASRPAPAAPSAPAAVRPAVTPAPQAAPPADDDEAARAAQLACSLENPESCEACQ